MTRALLFVLSGYLLLLVQASVRHLVPFVALVPDPALILVIYLGITPVQRAPVGAGSSLALGYLMDLLAAAPKGLHALAYVLAFLLARGAQFRLLTGGWPFAMVFTFCVALVSGLVVIGIRALADPVFDLRGLSTAVLQAVATGITAPVVFSLGRWIDRRTTRVAASGASEVKVLLK